MDPEKLIKKIKKLNDLLNQVEKLIWKIIGITSMIGYLIWTLNQIR